MWFTKRNVSSEEKTQGLSESIKSSLYEVLGRDRHLASTNYRRYS